jgi:outer membrane protein
VVLYGETLFLLALRFKSITLNKAFYTILLALTFGYSQSYAQRYWSLEECVQSALGNNITLKQRNLNVQSSNADLKQSKLGLLPNVNGQATNIWNIGFAINPITNTTTRDATFRNNSFGLNASMNVFNGFQQTNSVRLQESNLKAAQYDEQTTKNNIALQVCNAFMQVLMNEEITQSRKLQTEATKSQLIRQEKMYELGGINKTRVLQLRAQLANEELQTVTAEAQLTQSYLTLWQSINIIPDTMNKVKKPEFDVTTIEREVRTVKDVYEVYISTSPELKAVQQRERSADISKFVALGARSPRLSFNAGLNSFYTTQNQRGVGSPVSVPFPIGVDINGNPVFSSVQRYTTSEVVPFNTQFEQNFGRNYGLTLAVPIFNGWQVNTNVQKSKINRMSAELNKEQLKQDVMRNVSQAYVDFNSSWKRYEASVLSYDASKESYLLAEQQYNLGALSINEYLSTKNTYLQAETTFLQAKYEFVFRRKVLDFYLGKSLY